MQGKKQYQEKLFLNFQLSDRIPTDNFYRRLKEQMDLQWLYVATRKYYGSEGQVSIDPVVFFKLILIGYLENLGSDRRIINTVTMRLDMLYFIGYDIDEPLPWHSTLSRTRQLYGDDLFKQLFKQVLSQCIDKGMVSGRRQALDSVFVKANASMDSLQQKAILDDGDDYTSELTAEEPLPTDPDKGGSDTVSSARQSQVNQHHRWKAKAYKDMPKGKSLTKAESEDHIRPKFVSNDTHFSTTDRQARISVKPGKPRQLNYLAQVSVDTASHVITNIESHYADKKDSQCLAEAMGHTLENLSSQGLIVEEVLADGGYSSGEALQYLESQNLTGYIPNFGQYKPEREGFIYNEQLDQYECQQGNKAILPFKGLLTNSKGYFNKTYRSSEAACRNCPLQASCLGKVTKFKKIDSTIDKPLYDRMHERLQTRKAKRMKKLRSSTVEPVIGTLSSFLAMRRVNTRGKIQSNKCMLMAAIAYNLKKLLKFIHPKVQVSIQTISRAAKLLKNVFVQWYYSLLSHLKIYGHGI